MGYNVAGFFSSAGFTVNALRMVFLAQDLLTSRDTLIDILAHEASHVSQGYWSDSVKQEVKAYRTGAMVMEELKARGESSQGDEEGWLQIDDVTAKEKVRERGELAPVYRVIPCNQLYGLADKVEMFRQVAFVVRDFLRPR